MGLPLASSNLGVGRRGTPRVPAELSCDVHWNHESASGSLIDLSIAGAAVGLETPLPLETGARVRLHLETQDEPVIINAVLVTQSEEAFGTYVARLKFVGNAGTPQLAALVAQCVEEFRDSQAAVFRKHL